MKPLLRLLLGFLAAGLLLLLAKNAVARFLVVGGAKAIAGLSLKIDRMSVGLWTSRVEVQGLKLLNPRGFPDPVMMEMPVLFVDYDLPALFKGTVHLEELRLDLKEFLVEKNAHGKLNLDSLKVVQAKKKEPAPLKKPEPSRRSAFQIDSLDLRIGKVIYKDYPQGTPPLVREFQVGIHERYRNIRYPEALASLIVAKALMKTSVASLANFDLGPLTQEASDLIRGATGIATGLLGTAAETGTQAGEQVFGAFKKLLPSDK